MKTIIERGASWTMEETRLLLALWGQDLVQRQATNTKRTKEVYEKISDKFNQNGFERTADQVRTRVFNMIAEYRRILKEPNPDRVKKCVFFEPLHRIYQARHMEDVKNALDDYEPEYPYSPASNTVSSEKGDEAESKQNRPADSSSEEDDESTDGNELNNSTTTNSNNANNSTNANSTSSATTNNGDSNNNSNVHGEKESSSSVNSQPTGAPPKKMKLETSKSGQNQTNNATTSNSSNSSAPNTDNSITGANKQSSKVPIPLVATTTIGGVTSVASTASSSSTTTPSSAAASSSQRHQSLLLPHATAPSSSSATSTPISKLATSGSNNTPSYININSTKLPIIRANQLIGHPNGNEPINLNGTTTRLPTTAAITSHQLYQAPVNTFDVTSSALLIDRMFAHLSRESENMREWIALEKERLALERARRQQETEREARRERVLIDALGRFQDQWLSYIRSEPRFENSKEPPPELRIPPREGGSQSAEASQNSQTSASAANISSVSSATTSTTSASTNSLPLSDAGKQ